MAAKTNMTVAKPAASEVPVFDRLQLFWGGMGASQRVYLAVGLALTLAVLVYLGKMVATPAYKPLMTGLEASDAQAIAADLATKKIPYIVSPDGTVVSVPENQVDAARLEVASHSTPRSGRIGFEIFDKVSWGQTEFDEKVNYQRALEGELERTIQTISNVKSARVHLVMPTDSVFMDHERGAKASVTLQLRRGSLSRDEISEIQRLVAGAVDELKPGEVTIVDADSNQSLGSGNDPSDGSEGMERELTRQLVSTLAPVVGADHLRATVNVEFESGSSEESQEKYDPAVSATLNMQNSEEMTGPGAGIGGVPGTSSNVPSVKAAQASGVAAAAADKAAADKAAADKAGTDKTGTDKAAADKAAADKAAAAVTTAARDSGESSKTTSATYGVNKVTRHVIEPAGSIRRVTAAVLLDDAVDRKLEKGKWVETRRKRTPDELKLISELAQAAIGFNSVRGDVISVQNLAFNQAAPEELPKITFVDKARKGMEDYSAIFRYAGLLVLFFLVYSLAIKPIQKRALAPPSPQQLAASHSPLLSEAGDPASSAETAIHLAQRSQVLKKQLADFVRAEPESSTTAVRAWLREEAK